MKKYISVYLKFIKDSYNGLGTLLFYLFSGELIIIYFTTPYDNVNWEVFKIASIWLAFCGALRYIFLFRFFRKELKE